MGFNTDHISRGAVVARETAAASKQVRRGHTETNHRENKSLPQRVKPAKLPEERGSVRE